MPVGDSAGRVNWRFVGRGAGLALAALLLAGAAAFGLLFPAIPYGPVPEPPAIDQPAGPLPPAGVGVQVWAHYAGEPPRLAGSGFLLELPDGRLVGVTAAHSFDLSGGLHAIELRWAPQAGGAVTQAEPGSGGTAEGGITLTALHGEPGRARLFGNDLSGDYLLLVTTAEQAEFLPLAPDPRGGPQPGERIVVYSGVVEVPRAGAVFRSDRRGAWAVMEQRFDPALTSGAPVFSQHTGLVVGMALVAGEREGRTVLGMHPIGSLVEKGLAAEAVIPLGPTR